MLLIRNSTKALRLPLVGNFTVNGCAPTLLLCYGGGTCSSPTWSKHWDSSWWEGGRLALLRGAPSSCLCSRCCWDHTGWGGGSCVGYLGSPFLLRSQHASRCAQGSPLLVKMCVCRGSHFAEKFTMLRELDLNVKICLPELISHVFHCLPLSTASK